MVAKLTRLTDRIVIQLHLVAESCISLQVAPSYLHASSGVRSHNPSVRVVQDHTHLRPHGHTVVCRVMYL